MLPKVMAAIKFARRFPAKAIITSLYKAVEALDSKGNSHNDGINKDNIYY